MTTAFRSFDRSTKTRNSVRFLSGGILAGLWCLSGCSLKDMTYLSKGESKAQGGDAGSGGKAGEGNQGGGGETAGGGSGGAGAGGTTATECTSEQVTCPDTTACVDLSVGLSSGKTVAHCGSCETTCALTNAKSAACEASACKPDCSAGFADCNEASLNDGCEANISTAAACGACGRTCSMVGVAAQGCAAGKCAPTCLTRRADCNQDTGSGTDDGCELDLNSLTRCGTTCTDGVACATSQVCNATGCGAPQGLVEVSVPFTAAGQGNRVSDRFLSTPDLTNDTLTVRLYAPNATSGYISIYVGDNEYSQGALTNVSLGSLNAKWTDVTLHLGQAVGDFDPVVVRQVNFDIFAETPGPWANPTLIYLDSIWSSDGSVNDTFNTSTEPFVKSSLLFLTGSTFTWRDALP